MRDKLVLLFEVTTVHGLVGSLDLNSNGGLTSLADRDGLVIALDGCAVKTVALEIRQKKDEGGQNLHSTNIDDLPYTSGVGPDRS